MEIGTCKFFNGAHHNKECAAGVNYDSVTTNPDEPLGRALQMPCHSRPFPNSTPSQLEHFNNRGKCAKYTDPTELEIAEADAEFELAFSRVIAAGPLIRKIKKDHKGNDWQGVEVCPNCKGRLHMSHSAYNGHVWGKCETPDCLNWME